MPKPRKLKHHPLYPEPGAWVLRKTRGMPEMVPPAPLPQNHQLTLHEIRDEQIAYEGLGYCIYELISAEKIEDKELAKLWKAARCAMQDVVEYLETIPGAPGGDRRPLRQRKQPISKYRGESVTVGKDAMEQNF